MENLADTRERLREHLLRELSVPNTSSGRRVTRAVPAWEADEIHVVGYWVLRVEPAFDPMAELAVVETRERRRFAFAVERRRQAPLGDVQTFASSSADLPASWQDALLAGLENVTLYERGGGVTLDGIGYRIELDTTEVSCTIELDNPTTDGGRELEAAALAAARGIADVTGDDLVAEYLGVWSRWVR